MVEGMQSRVAQTGVTYVISWIDKVYGAAEPISHYWAYLAFLIINNGDKKPRGQRMHLRTRIDSHFSKSAMIPTIVNILIS